jgi:hypothetical protein
MVPIEEELCESYTSCGPEALQAYKEEALRQVLLSFKEKLSQECSLHICLVQQFKTVP